jgi:hypothetical protein
MVATARRFEKEDEFICLEVTAIYGAIVLRLPENGLFCFQAALF